MCTVQECTVGGGSFHTPPQAIVYTDSSVNSAFSYIHHVYTVQLCHTTDHQRYTQSSNLFSDLPSCQGAVGECRVGIERAGI